MCVGGVVYVCVQTICFRSLGVNLVYLPALTEIFFFDSEMFISIWQLLINVSIKHLKYNVTKDLSFNFTYF